MIRDYDSSDQPPTANARQRGTLLDEKHFQSPASLRCCVLHRPSLSIIFSSSLPSIALTLITIASHLGEAMAPYLL
jgi:hypothetical protein